MQHKFFYCDANDNTAFVKPHPCVLSAIIIMLNTWTVDLRWNTYIVD